MNENVCRKCRRYAGKSVSGYVRGDAWLCARSIEQEESEVIPGHSYWKKNDLHPIIASVQQPPEWCDRPLEQVLLTSDAPADIMADSTIVFDGNDVAERKERNVLSKDVW